MNVHITSDSNQQCSHSRRSLNCKWKEICDAKAYYTIQVSLPQNSKKVFLPTGILVWAALRPQGTSNSLLRWALISSGVIQAEVPAQKQISLCLRMVRTHKHHCRHSECIRLQIRKAASAIEIGVFQINCAIPSATADVPHFILS